MVWPALAGFLFAATTFADVPPAGSQPVVASDDSLVYEVTDIQGKVYVSPIGTDPKLAPNGGWKPLKQGDVLRGGEQIKVNFRSKVKLAAVPSTPPTVILFDRATFAQVSELSLVGGVAKSRIDLGYGQFKAGVAESGTRSDMQITSPTATLSKKGTDIFGIEVRPDGRFNMFLTEQGRGLVQALQTQSTQIGGLNAMRTRFLTPGQWITQQMARAIDNVQFDRNVNITDVYGLQGMDQLFTMLNDRGFGFLLPANGGGNPVNFLDSQGNGQNGITNVPGSQQNGQPLGGNILTQSLGGVRAVGGGDFGIGQGSVPSVFGARLINGGRNILKPGGSGCVRPGAVTRHR